jgi:hypothetical protein
VTEQRQYSTEKFDFHGITTRLYGEGARFYGEGLALMGHRKDVWKLKTQKLILNHFNWTSSMEWTIPQLTKILNSTSLDKNFITAGKSITKLVIFQSFVAKCCKMRII